MKPPTPQEVFVLLICFAIFGFFSQGWDIDGGFRAERAMGGLFGGCIIAIIISVLWVVGSRIFKSKGV